MIILHYHSHNVQAVSELGDFLAHLPELIYYYICSHMIHTSIEGRTRTCHAQQWPTPSKFEVKYEHLLFSFMMTLITDAEKLSRLSPSSDQAPMSIHHDLTLHS